jgi:hypothetical protein
MSDRQITYEDKFVQLLKESILGHLLNYIHIECIKYKLSLTCYAVLTQTICINKYAENN